MTSSHRASFLLLLALFTASCAVARQRENDPIPAMQVEALAIGDSAERVVELLGAPTEVVQLGRRTAYRYDFTQTKSAGLFLLVVGFFNQDTHQDRVWVFLDEEQVVTHVGSTLAADEAEYAMPWSE
jgi:outer membrane protein assembly factor BamE (lipoprotein component of BamABCDE complex)